MPASCPSGWNDVADRHVHLMPEQNIIVWDLETVPDLQAAARMLSMVGAPDEEIRAALGSAPPELTGTSVGAPWRRWLERANSTGKGVTMPSRIDRTATAAISAPDCPISEP
jgi:hypothetical protein